MFLESKIHLVYWFLALNHSTAKHIFCYVKTTQLCSRQMEENQPIR